MCLFRCGRDRACVVGMQPSRAAGYACVTSCPCYVEKLRARMQRNACWEKCFDLVLWYSIVHIWFPYGYTQLFVRYHGSFISFFFERRSFNLKEIHMILWNIKLKRILANPAVFMMWGSEPFRPPVLHTCPTVFRNPQKRYACLACSSAGCNSRIFFLGK